VRNWWIAIGAIGGVFFTALFFVVRGFLGPSAQMPAFTHNPPLVPVQPPLARTAPPRVEAPVAKVEPPPVAPQAPKICPEDTRESCYSSVSRAMIEFGLDGTWFWIITNCTKADAPRREFRPFAWGAYSLDFDDRGIGKRYRYDEASINGNSIRLVTKLTDDPNPKSYGIRRKINERFEEILFKDDRGVLKWRTSHSLERDFYEIKDTLSVRYDDTGEIHTYGVVNEMLIKCPGFL
jgi:hypothetical protein